jgi:hypothetical protein
MPKERKFGGQSSNKNNSGGRKEQPRGGQYNQRGGNQRSDKKIGSSNLIRDQEPMRDSRQKSTSQLNSGAFGGALQTTTKRVVMPRPEQIEATMLELRALENLLNSYE